MSEQHTPTPWGFSRDYENGVEFNITSENWYVAVCCDAPGDGTPKENARRIVACVNACAGIPTDDLEQCPSGGLFHIAGSSNELVRQRDELLAALEPFAKVACLFDEDRRAGNMPRSGVWQSWPREDGDYELTVEYLRNARSAVASVKCAAK